MRSLTVSVRPQDVEAVLDGLVLVAPHGVHELFGTGGVDLTLFGEAEELAEAEEFAAHEPLVKESATADAPDDWRDRRSQTHRPQRIGEGLLVRPSWLPASDESRPRVEIVLDDRAAFGTGSHPTTRACLEALERMTPEDSLADLGCGSGVIAVAAALLGWGRVVALDVNPASVEAARANAELNNVEIETWVLDLTRESPPAAHALVANVPLSIHAEIVGRLGSASPRSVIASGVPAADVDALRGAYAGLALDVVSTCVVDGWAVVTFGEHG